jgi:hypothetical protein
LGIRSMRFKTARLTSAISGKVISRSIVPPEESATGVDVEFGPGVDEGVVVDAGVGVGVGVGVGLGVGVGVGAGVGVGVGDNSTTSVCRFGEPPSVQRMAPTANRRTIATPIERTSVGDKVRLGPTGSRGEPHSGQRNSLVTTVIFSFR